MPEKYCAGNIVYCDLSPTEVRGKLFETFMKELPPSFPTFDFKEASSLESLQHALASSPHNVFLWLAGDIRGYEGIGDIGEKPYSHLVIHARRGFLESRGYKPDLFRGYTGGDSNLWDTISDITGAVKPSQIALQSGAARVSPFSLEKETTRTLDEMKEIVANMYTLMLEHQVERIVTRQPCLTTPIAQSTRIINLNFPHLNEQQREEILTALNKKWGYTLQFRFKTMPDGSIISNLITPLSDSMPPR